MVRGLDVFKKYFEQYPDNYIIIGGTACDIIIEDAGFIPRATKDIDIILVVEALNTEFVRQFWQFIQDGNYQQKEKSNDDKEYYRLMKPENPNFPHQIELFSRKPDLVLLLGDAHLTPIPVDENLSSLSAILLNDDYYNYMLAHSEVDDGVHHASIEALICLKVIAFLEIRERIDMGGIEYNKQLRKHKADIFRLMVMLSPESEFDLPETIQEHLNIFAKFISIELPDKAIFKEMGLGKIDPIRVFEQFKKSFKVISNEIQ
jgi:hypothetical protein